MKHSTVSAAPAVPGLINGPEWNEPHRLVGVHVSADTTLNGSEDLVVVTTGGSGIHITLLPGALDDTVIRIIKVDSGVGLVTVVGVVNGDTDFVLSAQWQIVELRAEGGDWMVVSSVYLPYLQLSGLGRGSAFGFQTLLDLLQDDNSLWGIALRNKSAANGAGLSVFVDNNGDTFIAAADNDGAVSNNIILRGTSNGSNIRFGPDQSHGVAVTPAGEVELDGNVLVNLTSGGGATFGSIGGGNVTLKPDNFSAAARTQTMPNADGSVAVIVPPPATLGSAGVVGMIAFDTSFFYQCIAVNTWKKAPWV